MGCINNKISSAEGQTKNLLLLGVGGAGKSTIFKQIKSLHAGPFSENEKIQAHLAIINQIIEAIKGLINAGTEDDFLKVTPRLSTLHDTLGEINFTINKEVLADKALLESIRNCIIPIWSMPEVKTALKVMVKSDKYNSSNIYTWAHYFLDNAEEVINSEYKVTNDDLFRLRRQTSGSQNIYFKFEKQNFQLIDVGGQVHERNTWDTHFNSSLLGVIYLISLVDYCQVNTNGGNKLKESIELIKQLTSIPELSKLPFVILLNKSDLFQEHLNHTDFSFCYFNIDKADSKNKDFCLAYIKREITKVLNNNKSKAEMYVTNATDTELVKNMFDKIIASVQKISRTLTFGEGDGTKDMM